MLNKGVDPFHSKNEAIEMAASDLEFTDVTINSGPAIETISYVNLLRTDF